MDSGNTSSLHSSSGGGSDDVDSLSAFFHTSASPSPSGVTLPPPPLLSSVGPHFFDYSSLFYLDSSSSSSSSPATLLPSASGSQPSETAVGPQTDPPPAPAPAPAPRSSRKRSRASRRAPTTVLTTDASNFRAMVQEFTGIPAAPFGVPAAASSPFLRSRIDQILHPSSSAAAAAAASPFLLGPFPHNPHSSPSFPTPIHNPPPPLPPSLNLTSPASATVTAAVTNSNSNQLTPNLHYLLQPPTPATFFSSDDFADLPQAALMLPDPAPSSWATVEFSGANVSQPLIGAASSCKPSYSSSAAPAAELVIRAKNIDSEIAGKRADGEADPSWIHSSSD